MKEEKLILRCCNRRDWNNERGKNRFFDVPIRMIITNVENLQYKNTVTGVIKNRLLNVGDIFKKIKPLSSLPIKIIPCQKNPLPISCLSYNEARRFACIHTNNFDE